jgi:hypothetical protein
MRIKLDENLPPRLVSVLSELGHDVDTVPSERIAGKDDAVVWQAPRQAAVSSSRRIRTSLTSGSTHRARITVFCWSGFRNQGGPRCSRESP